ncbi:MAG: 16S rRNA (guanine(966)-N(2))-methyltransferase RsmD [Pseudomonadota bacterium]
MRIIAGTYRGRRLAALGKGDTVAHLRPTSDRVRESLFSHLLGGAYDDPVTDARVLDLFAGTGALGLEALSRGAAGVTFIDNGRAAWRLLSENIRLLGVQGRTNVLRQNAVELGRCGFPPFSLVFLDPPYGRHLGEKALARARRGGWLASEALIVWEEGRPVYPPPEFVKLEQRQYGDTILTVMKAPAVRA